MSDFSVPCNVCGGEVHSYEQKLQYILTPDEAVQQSQTIELSCGCTVDFPDWQINLQTGECRIVNFAGTLFIEFRDIEMIMEEEE